MLVLPTLPVVAEPVILQRITLTADVIIHQPPKVSLNIMAPTQSIISHTSQSSKTTRVDYSIHGGQQATVALSAANPEHQPHCGYAKGKYQVSNKLLYCLDGYIYQKKWQDRGKIYHVVPTERTLHLRPINSDKVLTPDYYVLTMDITSYFP